MLLNNFDREKNTVELGGESFEALAILEADFSLERYEERSRTSASVAGVKKSGSPGDSGTPSNETRLTERTLRSRALVWHPEITRKPRFICRTRPLSFILARLGREGDIWAARRCATGIRLERVYRCEYYYTPRAVPRGSLRIGYAPLYSEQLHSHYCKK